MAERGKRAFESAVNNAVWLRSYCAGSIPCLAFLANPLLFESIRHKRINPNAKNKPVLFTLFLRRREMRKALLVITSITMSAGLWNYALADTAGSALLFDGSNDYVHAPYISAYQLPVFTVEAWIYPTIDLSVEYADIVCRGEDAGTDNQALNLCTSPLNSPWGQGVSMAYEDSQDGDYVYSTGFYPAANAWTHVAAVRSSGGHLSIYSNGNLLAQWDSTATPSPNCFQELTIGANWDAYPLVLSNFFVGAIDEVRIWNVARTDAEIAANYNRLVNPSSAELAGYWNFDDGAGIVAHDLTGLNNAALGLNGTGTDVPTWITSTAPIVPEPATIALLGLGGVLLRRSKR